jgi:hypothetical protein
MSFRCASAYLLGSSTFVAYLLGSSLTVYGYTLAFTTDKKRQKHEKRKKRFIFFIGVSA